MTKQKPTTVPFKGIFCSVCGEQFVWDIDGSCYVCKLQKQAKADYESTIDQLRRFIANANRVTRFFQLATLALVAMQLLSGCITRVACPTMSTMPKVPGALVTEEELRAEWTKRFGPLPSPACDPVMQWRVRTDEQTQTDCQTAKWGYTHVAGCGMWLPGNCPMAVVSERSKDDLGLQAHEWAHFALGCTWRGTWVNNSHPAGVTAEAYSDPYHTIKTVWGGAGSDTFEGYFRTRAQAK